MTIPKFIIFFTKPLRYFFDNYLYKLKKKSINLKKLKNKHLNETIIIVGNGPSLNDTPLDKLTKYPSIGMNKIDLIYQKTSWRPDYIVVNNNLVIKQHWRFFLEYKEKILLAWKSRIFIKSKYRRKFNYFNVFNNKNFSKEFDKGVGSSGTVTFTALQLAYYMGASKVVLIGIDHNFKFTGKPNDIEKITDIDQNHFDPNYFKIDQLWGVPNLKKSEEGYQIAKEAFEQDGREVLDATVNGKLKIFKKVAIEDII